MKSWKIVIDGKENKIDFIPNNWSSKCKLIINGEEVEFKKAPLHAFVGTDQQFDIAGKKCHFVLIGNKADIAVDGIYVDSKKEYIPLKNIPWWTWLFVVACVMVPIVSFGGAVPVVIGLLCASWCIRVSVSSNLKMSIKALFCFGVAVLAWLLLGLLLFVFSN